MNIKNVEMLKLRPKAICVTVYIKIYRTCVTFSYRIVISYILRAAAIGCLLYRRGGNENVGLEERQDRAKGRRFRLLFARSCRFSSSALWLIFQSSTLKRP